jgi:N-acetyl-anhydromuramyl-L-alanine amidase AmpD
MNIIKIPIPRGGRIKGRVEQFPNRVIVHAMAEYIIFKGKRYHAVEWLEKSSLSAHVFFCPNGHIIRSREDNQEAIHAAGNNYNTIGAEWLVPGEYSPETYHKFIQAIHQPYISEIQLMNSIQFAREEWVEKCGILKYEKHSQVDPKGNKQDPGDGFPWSKFLKGIGVII